MITIQIALVLHTVAGWQGEPASSPADQKFARLAERYVDQFPALSPVSATLVGDHRFDGKLDEVSPQARSRSVTFYREFLRQVEGIEIADLSRPNQIDSSMLQHHLRSRLWHLEVLESWAWNPLTYTELSGSAIYGLMAREFAPLPQRLGSVGQRLGEFPRLFRQIRATLQAARVPRIHAETAVKQNRGVLSILDNMVKPQLDVLRADERQQLTQSMEEAVAAVEEHQRWLESELLPQAQGDFRLGSELYDRKLAFALQTPLTRPQVRDRADRELRRVRQEMYGIAKQVYGKTHPFTQFPASPSPEYEQALIRAGLEMAYRETPGPHEVVETAKRSLAKTTEFVRDRDLITIPPDPLEIIVMPEFQRGVSLAYCDSPGPLDVGQETFYAVAPLPDDWNAQQVQSFLREYNTRSIHDLTIHEAMPGHFVQLAHANRYPGRLRAVLSSGVFIEGWAVYAEQMMCNQGFLDRDPLQRLITLKWYLRGIGNAIMDQAIHTEGMTRDQAMKLMMEDTFQEEREAAAKWVRAQLTSAQLATYFVGYLEISDLRREAERVEGQDFELKKFHDRLLSFGSPPVQYVRALLFNQEIPR